MLFQAITLQATKHRAQLQGTVGWEPLKACSSGERSKPSQSQQGGQEMGSFSKFSCLLPAIPKHLLFEELSFAEIFFSKPCLHDSFQNKSFQEKHYCSLRDMPKLGVNNAVLWMLGLCSSNVSSKPLFSWL